jgi:hypothetical protein
MDIMHKDATITNTDDTGPGAFEVILSAPTKDRDGDTLLPEEWKQPLPEHITFDADHGMSVATTVGSGVPRIDEKTGNLIVSGTYSSLPRAQEVRTLVNEGHIRTTSVAFMSEKTEKDGKTSAVRELLNGAFVAVPSNRDALVLASKTVKAGARNSASDAEHIQAIHDHAVALGAVPAKSYRKELDPPESPDPEVTADLTDLALAVDAAVDQALALLNDVDLTSLPEEVQRAIALIQTADAASDDLLDALGVPDPDEDTNAGSAAASDAAKAADETAAEFAAQLQTRVRAVQMAAQTYAD